MHEGETEMPKVDKTGDKPIILKLPLLSGGAVGTNGHSEAGRHAAADAAAHAQQGGTTAPALGSGLDADLPELAREPDLIAAIRSDIAAVGVVGEEDNGLLVYIAYTSRLQDDPLAVVTRGVTGTGKSTLLEKVARLFPESAKYPFMKFTEASLFNGPEDSLSHKILITGERKHSKDDATRDANALLRQLLSEKEIRRSVSVPGGEDGRWVTEMQVRRGPVAYAESTTAGSIFEEDLNRMLELYTDDSPQQNRRVKTAIGRRYDPDAPADAGKAAAERNRAFQESLRPYRVVIPYWKPLVEGIPDKNPRCRRAAQQVLSVVEALALLNQHQRDKRGDRLVAARQDYDLARQLLLAPLHAALGLKEQVYAEYRRLRKALRKKTFDSNEALAHFGNKMARDRMLKCLCDLELLKQEEAGSSHKPARWTWASGKTPAVEEMVLPSVDAVCGP